MSEDLSPFMVEVARLLWGPERPGGTKTELRFGEGRTVNPVKGGWWVHDGSGAGGNGSGGGPLQLIKRELKCSDREAFDWLRAKNFPVGEPPQRDAPRVNGAHHQGNGVARPQKRLVKTYDYVGPDGELRFQVCRFEPKSFGQRRPDGRGGWEWNLEGVERVLYRLPEVEEAVASEALIFLVEGEKDADNLWQLGAPATTNPGGARKWLPGYSETLRGADVVILPDNDPSGAGHVEHAGAALSAVCSRLRVLHLPGLPDKGDVSDWIAAGGTVDQLYELVEREARPYGEQPFRSAFGTIFFRDLDKITADAHSWLIKGVMVDGERSMMVGASGAGKSFEAIKLGMCVAMGEDYRGHRVRQGLVIYEAGEGAKGAKLRLRAHRAHLGLKPDADIPFAFVPRPVDLFGGEEHTDAFVAECQAIARQFPEHPLRLVVIDTLSASTVGIDENSSRDMTTVLGRVARIAAGTGAHVCLVHHMNASGQRERGHSSLRANIDSVIEVLVREGELDQNERKVREVVLTKVKDGDPRSLGTFVLRQVVVGRDSDGDDVTSCVIDPPMRPEDDEKAVKQLSTNEKIAWRALQKAIGETGIKPPGMLQLPASIEKVCEYENWKREYARVAGEGVNVEEAAKSNKVAQAVSRAGKEFLGRGWIGRHTPYVWIVRDPQAPRRRKPPPNDAPPMPDDAKDLSM